jgi:uncharacterized damage-inducible protein DinB
MKTVLVSMLATVALYAGGPADPAKVFGGEVKQVESEFVSLAEAMPADKYDFAPATGEFKAVRTFAQQVKHVASVNYIVAAAVLGGKPPVDTGGEAGPVDVKSKDDIVKYLKASFAYCEKAAASLTAKNLLDEIDSPFGDGKSSRLGTATVIGWHSFDHYGQMVVYARMNGVVPPASK